MEQIEAIAINALRLNENNLDKIVDILRKPEEQREAEEIHLLSMALKKKVLDDQQINDWWLLHRCIQSLVVSSHNHVKPSKIEWIHAVEGSFWHHGMEYGKGESLTVSREEGQYLSLEKEGVYLILTRSGLEAAKKQSQHRKIYEQKELVRKVLTQKGSVKNSEFNELWLKMLNIKIKRGTYLELKKFEDMLFIVVSGTLGMDYAWRRTIKLRHLGEGSMFSTYLGRYFNTTSQKLRNNEKVEFEHMAVEDCLLLAIPVDMLYEEPRFQSFKFLVEDLWRIYLSRASEIGRIIQKLGTLKPEKREVEKSLRQQREEKELRDRAISVPVAIEKRKFHKFIDNFFQERSNRRKLPNLASPSPFSRKKRSKTSRTEAVRPNPELEDSPTAEKAQGKHQRSNTEMISRSKGKARLKASFSLDRLGINSDAKARQPESQNFSGHRSFFHVEEFLSHKLKMQYKTILEKQNRPEEQTINLKNYRSDNQYFKEYVNERRIVKLGPKKRLLYKVKKGF